MKAAFRWTPLKFFFPLVPMVTRRKQEGANLYQLKLDNFLSTHKASWIPFFFYRFSK